MKCSICLFAVLVFFPSMTRAGVMYAFEHTNYTVAAGGTVDIKVYLEQTGGETILTDFGIIGASVNVLFNEVPGPLDPAEVLNDFDISPSTAFDDPVLTEVFHDPGVSAGLVGVVDIGSAPLTGSSIYLGTFTFTAGAIDGEVTMLRATDLSLLFEDTVAFDGTELDGLIGDGFSQITVTSAAVPEPASSAVAGAMVLVGWCVRKRRHRRTQSRSCEAVGVPE
jgi:hypothetical protein